MKPTNDERREVAAELRKLAVVTAYVHLPGSNLASLLFSAIHNGTEWDVSDRNPDGLFLNRLADLIDPHAGTCELELTWGGQTNAHVRTYECSRCGKSCDSVWGEDYEFCPYCGRRVEYADE